ncbi:hypothetical protein HK097_006941 [Rhizophlyctis rosea]|uniref:Uncharacterized protein n=1 Tax=Rhizophlyctis rosea TaxID=64517 RepID=A0AAD5SCB6_9FUNG|nr:hypothetical protein HK097_006941 [Rhizophlyctis rosea]
MEGEQSRVVVDIFSVCLKEGHRKPQIVQRGLDGIEKLLRVGWIIGHQQEDEVGRLITDLARNPVWDVRDTVMGSVARCFESNENDVQNAVDFATRHDLPKLVLSCLADDEAYVRASALRALERIIVNPAGNLYIQAQIPFSRFIKTVKHVLANTEAFVRRAAWEFVTVLAKKNGVASVFGEDGVGKKEVQGGLADVDWEVRVKVVEGLEVLVGQLGISAGGKDRGREEEVEFWRLGGDALVLQAIKDPSRLVRQAAHHLITHFIQISISSKPQPSQTSPTTNAKRARVTDPRTEAFLMALDDLDLAQLEESTVPEYLYQEALDVDRSVMEEVDARGEGNNVLTCYDC